uniref:Uncharacterized protein n=1 Tax=Oryza rufipogon TaxID=4529 RepID=A0A0E0NNC9_ORYRU
MAMDEPPKGWNPNYGVVGSGDRRLAFSRQLSSSMPRLARSDSSISMPPPSLAPTGAITFRWLATRPMRRLALLIALNVAYSATELAIGLLTARVVVMGKVIDMEDYMTLQGKLTKHYLIVSAVTNLLVNLLGVWFFRSYARVNIVYRKAEDMNYHSVCLHVLADSVRRVENAEVLCLGIVSVAVFMLVLPLFKATGNILLQIAPGNVPPSALTKCFRQITACEDVSEVCQGRFWELVPGHAVGSLDIRIWAYRT